MTLDTERRILQLIIAAMAVFSLSAAGVSIARGPDWLGYLGSVPTDLDSHFRYLSGLQLGIAIGFLSCIPKIEARGHRFRLTPNLIDHYCFWVVVLHSLNHNLVL